VTEATRDLLKRALELPLQERAILVHGLLDTIDDPHALDESGDLSSEWREEIARRLARPPKAGEATPDEVIAEGLRRVDVIRRDGKR
jgi:putative addiction module component (TIGR02574 family)